MTATPTTLQRLLPRHFRILELCLEGFSKKDIAGAIGMTPQAISLITNSPLFQDELARRRAERNIEADDRSVGGVVESRRLLEEASAAAAQTAIDLLGSEDERVQLSSANSILDRVFNKEEGAGPSGLTINVDQLKVLQIAIQESK